MKHQGWTKQKDRNYIGLHKDDFLMNAVHLSPAVMYYLNEVSRDIDNIKHIKLPDYFQDYKKPTDEEREMLAIELSISYPPQHLLDKLYGGQHD